MTGNSIDTISNKGEVPHLKAQIVLLYFACFLALEIVLVNLYVFGDTPFLSKTAGVGNIAVILVQAYI